MSAKNEALLNVQVNQIPKETAIDITKKLLEIYKDAPKKCKEDISMQNSNQSIYKLMVRINEFEYVELYVGTHQHDRTEKKKRNPERLLQILNS